MHSVKRAFRSATLRLLGIDEAFTLNPDSTTQSVLIGRKLEQADILERLLHVGRILDWEDDRGAVVWGRIIQPPQRWNTGGELFIRVMHDRTKMPAALQLDNAILGPIRIEAGSGSD